MKIAIANDHSAVELKNIMISVAKIEAGADSKNEFPLLINFMKTALYYVTLMKYLCNASITSAPFLCTHLSNVS